MSTAGPPAAEGPETLVVTVGEFSRRLHGVFRRVRTFDYLGVSGEVSEWTQRQNGVYFTIKDENAVLQCFAYRNRAEAFPKLALGAAIVAYGTLRVAAWRSRYELLVNSVRLTGVGELFRQYEALKARFRELGYFESSRKRPIPAFPRSIVLISARGKGAEDFLTTLRERAPHVRVDFIETRVQGVGADVEIADAFDRASRVAADAIVLARGGGAYEDLFAFNREPVVRAIVRSPVPVITGIGHTGDHHLADDVADLECETPSNAAQFIASLWQRGGERLARLEVELQREVRDVLTGAMQRADVLDERLTRAWERADGRLREKLAVLERRLSAQSPAVRVARWSQRLTELDVTLRGWQRRTFPLWKRAVDQQRERLGALRERFFSQRAQALTLADSRLLSLNPHKPLERGYAIVTLGGRVLRDAREAAPGDEIAARLFHGTVNARVERVDSDE